MVPSDKQQRSLSVGLIGCGKMSKNHVKAINAVGSATITAVCDPAMASEDLPDWIEPGVEFYSDAAEMLAGAQVDVVHIITPPETHFSLAMQALNTKKHVFIEKPFLLNSPEADQLWKLAEQEQLKVCAGHQLLFTRTSTLLENALTEIGQITDIESYFSFNQVRKGISPADQLADIAPHPTYLLEHFLSLASQDPREFLELRHVSASYNGEARALLRLGNVNGSLIITLSGRPVDSYLKITGTNGSIHADYVRGYILKRLGPGASIFSALLLPYITGLQLIGKNTGAIFRLFSERKKGYPGLPQLVEKFYSHINGTSEPPISAISINNTVKICEAINKAGKLSDEEHQSFARKRLEDEAKALPPIDEERSNVLITGGTGLFGRPTASLLRREGWKVTVLSRNKPPFQKRVPGVDYIAHDLANPVPEGLLDGVGTIIHAAAETLGGKSAHERNSIQATINLLNAAETSGVRNFVHISSIAVLKPGSKRSRMGLSESSPIDLNNLGRGPYVWGKAESERIASEFGEQSQMGVKIVRLGPLVDFSDYKPPGRLGREIHNLFVAMGNANDKLSICSTETAAIVMSKYVADFTNMPALLNLIEPDAPTRKELLRRWKEIRRPLRSIRLHTITLYLISKLLVILQRVFFRSKSPLDVYAAFSSENYDTALISSVLARQKTE